GPVEGEHAAEQHGEPENARRRDTQCVGIRTEGEPEQHEHEHGEEQDGVGVRPRPPLRRQVLPRHGGHTPEFGPPRSAHGTTSRTAPGRPVTCTSWTIRPPSRTKARSSTPSPRARSWVTTSAAPPRSTVSRTKALSSSTPSASKLAYGSSSRRISGCC